MEEISLGDKVKCKLTGFTGIAVAKTEFINGCIQYGVVSKIGKDKKYPDEINIDESSLEIIKRKKEVIEKDDNGGATRVMPSMQGF